MRCNHWSTQYSIVLAHSRNWRSDWYSTRTLQADGLIYLETQSIFDTQQSYKRRKHADLLNMWLSLYLLARQYRDDFILDQCLVLNNAVRGASRVSGLLNTVLLWYTLRLRSVIRDVIDFWYSTDLQEATRWSTWFTIVPPAYTTPLIDTKGD